MEKYRVTFDGWGRRHDKDVALAAFVRAHREESSRLFCLGASGPSVKASKIEDREELKVALLRAGLRKVREMLAAGAFDCTERGSIIDVPIDLDELLSRRVKHCKYYRDGENGAICGISLPDDKLKGMVLPQLCEACEIPDSDVMCMHMTHLGTTGIQTMGPTYTRLVARVACNLGLQIRSAAQCHPGTCQDWAQEAAVHELTGYRLEVREAGETGVGADGGNG